MPNKKFKNRKFWNRPAYFRAYWIVCPVWFLNSTNKVSAGSIKWFEILTNGWIVLFFFCGRKPLNISRNGSFNILFYIKPLWVTSWLTSWNEKNLANNFLDMYALSYSFGWVSIAVQLTLTEHLSNNLFLRKLF